MANCQELSATTCSGGRAASTVFIPLYAARRYKQEAATVATPKFSVNSNTAMGLATATLLAHAVRRAIRRAIAADNKTSNRLSGQRLTSAALPITAKGSGNRRTTSSVEARFAVLIKAPNAVNRSWNYNPITVKVRANPARMFRPMEMCSPETIRAHAVAACCLQKLILFVGLGGGIVNGCYQAEWKACKKGRPPALPAAFPVEGVQPGLVKIGCAGRGEWPEVGRNSRIQGSGRRPPKTGQSQRESQAAGLA